ncbi:MAG TPA: tetratricopeptide repeat protein [Geobacteraceae bacterium]
MIERTPTMPGVTARFYRILTEPARRSLLLCCLLLSLVGLAAYSNSFSVPFSFDDTKNILANPAINNFSAKGPLPLLRASRGGVDLTFLANLSLHGWTPLGFHLVNLAIHLATALLVYALVSMIERTPFWVGRDDTGGTRVIAFFTALLFVAHPLQTQAVTYIVQRYTSFTTLCYVASVFCYGRGRLIGLSHRTGRAVWWCAGAFVLALLAMRSKEIAYTLPFAVILFEACFFSGSLKRRLGISAAFLATLVVIPLTFLGGVRSWPELVAAVDRFTRVQTTMSRSDYLFTQFKVIVTYLRLLVLPVNQNLDYDYPPAHSFAEPRVWLSFLLLAVLAGTAAWLFLRTRHSGSGAPWQRLVAFGILWFFLALAVESSILPFVDVIFEHRVYLPSVGAFLAISAAVLGPFGAGIPRSGRAVLWGLVAVCLVLAMVTFKRNMVWATEISLWEDVTSKSPKSSRSWNNLAYAYLKERLPYKALPALIRSIELDGSHPDAWNNLGLALEQTGRYGGRFQKTVEMFENPQATGSDLLKDWYAKGYNNLGLAYELQRNLKQAIYYYEKSIGMDPAFGEAYYNLGLALLVSGDRQGAAVQAQVLALLNPPLARRLQYGLSVTGGR